LIYFFWNLLLASFPKQYIQQQQRQYEMPVTCSVCNQEGHNIHTCVDHRIDRTWKQVQQKIIPFIGLPGIPENSLRDIQRFLRSNIQRNLLKAVSVQMANSRSGDTLKSHMESICRKLNTELVSLYVASVEVRDAWIFATLYEEDQSDYRRMREHRITRQREAQNARRFRQGFQGLMEIRRILAFEDQEPEPESRKMIDVMMLCLESAAELSALSECSICFEEKRQIELDTTNCGHIFCHGCICRHIDSKRQAPQCPLCRTEIKMLEVKDVENYDDISTRYGSI